MENDKQMTIREFKDFYKGDYPNIDTAGGVDLEDDSKWFPYDRVVFGISNMSASGGVTTGGGSPSIQPVLIEKAPNVATIFFLQDIIMRRHSQYTIDLLQIAENPDGNDNVIMFQATMKGCVSGSMSLRVGENEGLIFTLHTLIVGQWYFKTDKETGEKTREHGGTFGWDFTADEEADALLFDGFQA